MIIVLCDLGAKSVELRERFKQRSAHKEREREKSIVIVSGVQHMCVCILRTEITGLLNGGPEAV